TLSGFAYDRAGIESVSYTLGGVTHPLTLDQQGRFSTSVTLSAGNNRIEVTARGKSGKEGKAEITVTYNPPPAEIAVSATSAPRGGTITITGQNLGTSGTVTVGGVEATVVEWSASQVTVTLSDDTPHGYQEIVVTSPSGQDAYRDFFVGVEYDGNGAGLQEFLDGLTRGTAVLLGDGTYDLDPEGGPGPDGISFIINNHSL